MSVVIFNKHQNPEMDWCDEVVNVMRPNLLKNPYPITHFDSRESVIAKHRVYLDALVKEGNNPVAREIERLRQSHRAGKSIGLLCCCYPQPCHAGFIKELIEEV